MQVDYGSRLRVYRAEHRVKQGDLAKKLGLSVQALSRYERGLEPGAKLAARFDEFFTSVNEGKVV